MSVPQEAAKMVVTFSHGEQKFERLRSEIAAPVVTEARASEEEMGLHEVAKLVMEGPRCRV